jgi:CheY-like chemotaxis protein
MEPAHKLLIVDDCQTTRLMVKEILGNSFEYLESDNGNGVIPMVIKEKPSLILLDLSMPEKDGFEVLEELLEEHYHIPVIIISGDTTKSTHAACASLGVEAYLDKPLQPELLRKMVNQHFS